MSDSSGISTNVHTNGQTSKNTTSFLASTLDTINESDEIPNKVGLLELPDEILLKIFKYFDPYFLNNTITIVCRKFSQILNDEKLWYLMLIKSIKRNLYEQLDNNNISICHPVNYGLNTNRWWCSRDLLWRDIAVQFCKLEKQWKFGQHSLLMQKFEQPHYAAIDAIKVIGDGFTIVSGGRDRLINLWKINANTLKAERNFNAIRCHDGWIWDIDSCTPDTFYSSGWDNNVIYWSISSVLERINTFNCGKPVMAISCTNGLVAAGLSTPKIVLIDPRVGQISQIPSDSIRLFDMHKHSITDVLLVPERNLLLSISEDKSMAFFDLRQQKRLSYKTKRISHENSFPRCLSLYRNVVYIGDSRGNVHFYSLESHDIILSPINVGTETRLVTGIVPHMSGITVSTTDGFVRILYPSKPPVFIWQQAFHGEVTAIDQTKHFLVVSTSESNINIFKPIHL